MKIETAHKAYIASVEARKKRIKAMRKQKLTWKEIGAALGISKQRAQQIGSKE